MFFSHIPIVGPYVKNMVHVWAFMSRCNSFCLHSITFWIFSCYM